MNSNLTDIIRFIYLHPKREKICNKRGIVELTNAILTSLDMKGLVVIYDMKDNIDGIVVTFPNHEQRILNVSMVCASNNKGVMKCIMRMYREYFDGYKIEMNRGDRFVAYDEQRTTRFINLLSKI